MLSGLTPDPKTQLAELERRLRELDAIGARLSLDRAHAVERLAQLRKEHLACAKCGHTDGFLTDAGGYLARVLEDPTDTEMLQPGKPLYCPECGEVTLWDPPRAPVARPRRRPAPSR